MIQALNEWAKKLKKMIVMLWFATQHPEMPWVAKVICIFVAAYALSPIDLIPDFIPVLGYLDDVILLPVLIWIALCLIPEKVKGDSILKANAWWEVHQKKPKSQLGLILVLLIWIGCALAAYVYL
jgi:uncharacterized membrane protein YkvA (DUF1232 family)